MKLISTDLYNRLLREIDELKAEREALNLYNKQLIERLMLKAEVPLTTEQIYGNMEREIKNQEDSLGIFNDLDGGDIGDAVEAAFGRDEDKNQVSELI